MLGSSVTVTVTETTCLPKYLTTMYLHVTKHYNKTFISTITHTRQVQCTSIHIHIYLNLV